MSKCLLNCEKQYENEIFNNLETVFIPRCKELEEANSQIFIGEHVYDKNIIIEEIKTLTRLVQAEWCSIQNIALYDDIVPYDEIVYSRKLINESFSAIKYCIQLCTHQQQKERYTRDTLMQINLFSNLVVPLDQIGDDFIRKISALRENDTKNPVFQYFHTFLEVQYHLFTLQYICKVSEADMDKAVEKILLNLIVMFHKNYYRESQTLKNVVCTCMKDILLILELFYQKIDDENKFWRIFNKALEQEPPLFSLWLLKHVAEIQAIHHNLQSERNSCPQIKTNYDLVLSKLKPFFQSADSDMSLQLLTTIEPLLCNIWLKNAQINVYHILWDYFSKRLNVSKKNYSGSTALELNGTLENILWSCNKCNEDFEKFVGMLICHLREYPTHWGRMKGRIYSQLGPNKLKDLGETGIVHVMVLFIALGTTQYEELLKKILSFFESLSAEKKNTPLVWNVYTAFMFVQVRLGYSLERTAPLLSSLIHEASTDSKKFHLIKEFVSNFEHILNSSDKMQLNQWLLLGPWLSNYLPSCYYTDMNTTLEVLLSTLEKVDDADSWNFWMEPYKDHVLPVLRQISTCHNAPGIIGTIAGKLHSIVPQQISIEIFQFFTGEIIPPKISSHFLTVVLANYPSHLMLTVQQEGLAVQCWVKICLLSAAPPADLTKNITKLDLFPVALKTHVEASPEPIHALIEYLGSDIKQQHLHSSGMSKLAHLSFGQLDKWLGQYLAQPDSETAVLRVYTSVYLAFLHCGPLLYHRSRNSCPLTRLIQCMLLPMEFLTRKTLPHEFVLNAVRKTWHYFYEALVRMRTESDMFLERTLKDMITKYMPYFGSGDSPIVKALETEAVAPVILEKICGAYFKHPFNEDEANTLKVMKILGEAIRSTASESRLKLIVDKTLHGLFQVVIFHPQRNSAISLIKTITGSALYRRIKPEFRRAVLAVTQNHNNMAFNTVNYFQLMIVLAKFVPSDVKDLLGDIKEQVMNVERLRGVGFDKNLRLQFEKLEDAVKMTE